MVATASTKPKLSKVGLGCGTFGGAYGAAQQSDLIDTVRTALRSGINHLDTSPYYNDSETKLGMALLAVQSEFPRSTYHICTKVGRYGYHKADFDYSAQRIRASVYRSMRQMHTDYLDMVLCHDVEFVDIKQVVDQALPELFELKRQGVIRMVGISGYPLDVLLRICEILNERGCPLDACLSYCNYNLHCQILPDYVPKLRAAGVSTIIAASPLSMGLLHEKMTPQWHPAKQELKDAVSQCIEKIKPYQMSLAEMAEQFAFAYNKVDVHLVGAKTAQEVEHALNAYLKSQDIDNTSEQQKQANEMVDKILAPFASYTWPSPPSDA